MPSSLLPEERVRIRYHLGYPNVQQTATFAIGVPAAIETAFILESAMDRIIPDAEGLVRRHLAILDAIEGQEIDDFELLAVLKVDEIELNPQEMEKLGLRYDKWQASLAQLFGVIPNPFDQRKSAGGINARVSHG